MKIYENQIYSMKIKFNSDGKLPPNKTIEIPSMIIVVRNIFQENNKYYPQVFLDECLCKLQKQKKQKVSIICLPFYQLPLHY